MGTVASSGQGGGQGLRLGTASHRRAERCNDFLFATRHGQAHWACWEQSRAVESQGERRRRAVRCRAGNSASPSCVLFGQSPRRDSLISSAGISGVKNAILRRILWAIGHSSFPKQSRLRRPPRTEAPKVPLDTFFVFRHFNFQFAQPPLRGDQPSLFPHESGALPHASGAFL